MTDKILPTDELRRLKHWLTELGYTELGLQAAYGVGRTVKRRRNALMFLHRTREPGSLALLARLFLAGQSVPEELARREWPDWAFELFLEAGFLTRDSGALRPDIIIVPLGELLFISDALSVLGSEHAAEFVLPAGTEAAGVLVDITLRTSVGRTLDLGTGCGEQALLLAAHSEAVVATDINPRAVRYAEMNARLNSIDNVEFRTGDLFEPVAGESFDLIVTNPPFVPAPGKTFTYRDTDDELDGLCRRLVTQAPGYLAEGGVFQMLCEWVELRDEPWQQRIAGWLEGTGCDGWVLHWPPRSPDDYTAVRLGEVSGPALETGSEDFAQWIGKFFFPESHRDSCGTGGHAPPRRRQLDPLSAGGPARGRPGCGYDTSVSGRWRFRRCPGVRPGTAGQGATSLSRPARGTRAHEYRDERWQTPTVRARLAGGLALETELEPAAAMLLNQFDGTAHGAGMSRAAGRFHRHGAGADCR